MVFRLYKEENICSMEIEAAFVLLKNIRKVFNGKVEAVSGISLDVKQGEFFSLLGPSGCGKSTILRIIAGLETPDTGEVLIDTNTVAGSGWIPPEKRGVGLVFQDYALFPHMTVFDNIAFGLKRCGRKESKRRVEEMLDIVGLSAMSKRYPHELSGGQQQRVALARALAPLPKVILLDEPFSNLDADLRVELRTETKRILKEKGITTILVTHDQEEAFSLSDRIGILNNGRLEQVGTPAEIYHKPVSRFVAGFVGKTDFVSGRIQNGALISDAGAFQCPEYALLDNRDVDIMIRPDDVDFAPDEKGDALISDAQFLGPEVIYRLELRDGIAVHSIKPSTIVYAVGNKVKIYVDPTHLIVFPKEVMTNVSNGIKQY
jgi:iron(III) transport system ATP-binding protein